MSIEASWLLTGGYYGLSYLSQNHEADKVLSKSYNQVHQLCDKTLESDMFNLVYSADKNPRIFYEIWTMIEEYKRDNPHETWKHPYSFWGDVGARRYPFTAEQYLAGNNKRTLNKSDEDLIRMYKYRVITLLMNTRGSFGAFEAVRAINKGPHSDIAWTYKYG